MTIVSLEQRLNGSMLLIVRHMVLGLLVQPQAGKHLPEDGDRLVVGRKATQPFPMFRLVKM